MKSKRKVTKRIAAWFMCLAMVLTTINLPAFMTEVKAAGIEMPQGTGTSGNPYQISTADELFWFAEAVNNGNGSICAELTNNIVINSEGNPSPIVWTPIGTFTSNFKGTFDGQGYTIKGVYINDETSDYKGLFGRCNGSTIKDLTVVVDITGRDYVGGICGYLIESTVENCSVSGSVSSTSYDVGGICGYSTRNSTVENCSVSGNVSSTSSYVGGIVGYNDNGSIGKCYNSGSVQGESSVGGICGRFDGGNLANCYNSGSVQGKSLVGGICGCLARGNISKCYNLGTISHMGSGNYGSVIGYRGSNSITDCYYLKGTGLIDDNYSDGKTAEEFASGQVAYLLNGSTSSGELNWYQTIGTDPYPNFNSEGSKAVYYSYADCSATEKSYSNSEGSDTQGNHDFSADAEVVKIDGTKHGKECSICHQVVATGNHNFSKNGTCACGITQVKYKVIEGTKTVRVTGPNKDIDQTGDLVIPSTVRVNDEDYLVTEIGDNAFLFCSNLTSITIPSSVTAIGDGAFSWCSSLTSVTIPSSVTAIGNEAFSGCSNLTSITIPNSVTTIGKHTFSGCGGLTSVTIPSSVTAIGNEAFSGCSNLTSIAIPNSVTTIGDFAFNGCDSLTSVTIPSSVTTIGYGAFRGYGVESITIENGVTTIGNNAFNGCRNLKSVTIPNSVITIGDDAFFGCRELKSVTIPSNVATIGNNAFSSDCDVVIACNSALEVDGNNWGGKVQIIHDFSKYEQSENDTHIVKCSLCDYAKEEPEACSPSEEDPSQCVCGRKFGYPVTFNTNGGSAVEPASILVLDGDKLGTLPTTTKAGYTFAGWYSDKELTKKVTASTICKGEMNLYAKWTANKYSIKFDGNKATSGTMAAISGTYKEGDVLPANTFKKTGYTFNGWKDADGKTYKNKASIAPLAVATKAKEVTLTAQWKKNTYTITYELNGGKNSADNPETYTVTTDTITLAKPTRKGYTFAGWFSDETFTTKVTEIKKGSTGNKTLYAKWTKNKYTIEYVLNGGTNSADNPATYTVTTPTITLATPTRRGYKFSGWFSDDTYKTKVTEIVKGSTGKKTLYAKWAKNTYNITYVLNGGTNAEANPATYNVSTATITLAKPTKKGYTFKGWFTDKECTKSITEIKKGSTGSKTLYAKWSANSYNVKFNGNGATSGTMADVTGWKYGKEYELPANAFKKTGYTFKGWATTATGEVKYTNKESVKNLSSTNNKTVNLYAIWAKTKYKITYNLDGGTNNAENPASFYYTTATITLKNPTKTGYTFGGWYSDAEFKTRVKTIEKGTLKSVTLYAKWTENAYSITFDANALEDETVTGSMDAITGCKYTQTVILPENAFAREGYTFVNWNTAADGSGTAYAAGEEVSGLTGKRNGTVTLYAQWSAELGGSEEEQEEEPEGEKDIILNAAISTVTIYPMTGFTGSLDPENAAKCTFTSETDAKASSVTYELIEYFDGDLENHLDYAVGQSVTNIEGNRIFYERKSYGALSGVTVTMYKQINSFCYIAITVETKTTEYGFNINDYLEYTLSNRFK